MLVLGIDTSSAVASVALIEDEKVISEVTINHPKTHSQKLMPIIDQTLKNVDKKVKDLDIIAVTVGPGSFTGIRIGLSAAKAFAQSFEIPVVEVSSIEALAMNIQNTEFLICPVMDARRDQVYTGIYRWSEGSLQAVVSEDQLMIDEIIGLADEQTQTLKTKIVFLGDGVLVHREKILNQLAGRVELASATAIAQRGSSVAAIGKRDFEKAVRYDDVHANYIRKSQAEREYDERHSK